MTIILTSIECPGCDQPMDVPTNDLSHVNVCQACGAVFWFDTKAGVIQ